MVRACLPMWETHETRVRSLVQESPLEGHGNPLQYSCLENPQGQRSLTGYRPWSGKEQDTTEVTEHTCIRLLPSPVWESHLTGPSELNDEIPKDRSTF